MFRRYKNPRGYPGRYPAPKHIDLEKRSKAIHELLDKSDYPERPLGRRISFFIGSHLLSIYVKLIYFTSRQAVFEIHPETQKLIDDPEGHFIIAMWHNRLMYTVYCLKDNVAARGHDVLAIISESSDGEFIARCTEYWGAFTARGSSSKGGMKAIKKILRYVKLHFHPLVTPDGPRGPVYDMKEGLPAIAKLTGLPIIPMCSDAASKFTARSWDKFIIPKPFSRVVVSYGQPIHVPKNMDIDAACVMLKEKMMAQVDSVESKLKEITGK